MPPRQMAITGPFALWLIPISILAFTIRLLSTGVLELSLDEAISFFIASKPPGEIISYTFTQLWEHPPGYYLLLHYWIQMTGTSEFALRLLSAFGGVLGVVLVGSLARRWFGKPMGVLAALLMAVQPLAVWFGHNVRMYAWLYAATLVAVYALDRAIRRNRWRDWGLFLASMGLAVSLHYLAGVVVAAYGLLLLVAWRDLAGRRRRFLLIMLGLTGLPLLWLALAPGPRGSLLAVVARGIQEGWTPGRLSTIYVEWPLGSAMENLPPNQVFALSAGPWLLCLLGIVAMEPPRWWRRGPLQIFLAALVFTSPLVGSLLFTVVASRHHSAPLGFFVMATALGIGSLWRRRRWLGLAGLVLLLSLDGILVHDRVPGTWQPFGAPMQYIEQRANDREPIVYTHFFEWPLDAYYNQRGLRSWSIPDKDVRLTTAELEDDASEAFGDAPSLWLVLLPSVLEPERVEQTFNRLAFPGEKTWFPGSRGVIHYFGPAPLMERAGGMTWDESIRLNRWFSSFRALPAGDALRIEFEWRRLQPLDQHILSVLSLYGADGTLWAKHVSEPCNGWCLTTDWTDAAVVDRRAFEVPADVPPGDYTLRIGWVRTDGSPLMGRAAGEPLPQVDLPLITLRVTEPLTGVVNGPPVGTGMDVAVRPGLNLRGVQFADTSLQSGAALSVPMQWSVTGPQPALEAHLLLDRDGTTTTLAQPLGPAWYPSDAWQAPRSVRTLPQFTLPGTLAPGEYRASLQVTGADGVESTPIDLGTLTVQDRPRIYTVPEMGAAVGAAWDEGARLARIDVAQQAQAGQSLPVTLVWQAGGPLSRNWKIFVHLAGQDGKIAVQHDGYPAGGRRWRLRGSRARWWSIPTNWRCRPICLQESITC